MTRINAFILAAITFVAVLLGNEAQASVAPQATNGASVMCFMTTQGKRYVSSIFDGANEQKDKANWEIAFPNYIYTHLAQFPGNSACIVYPSAARAQQTLQAWKNQMGAKLVETGWTYKGPEPGPNGNNPKGSPPAPGAALDR